MARDNYPDNWDELRREVYKRDNYTCQRCGAKGKKVGGDAEINCHHIVPRSRGGTDNSYNLITLCEECHIAQPGHSCMLNDPAVRQRHLERMQKDGLTDIVRNTARGVL